MWLPKFVSLLVRFEGKGYSRDMCIGVFQRAGRSARRAKETPLPPTSRFLSIRVAFRVGHSTLHAEQVGPAWGREAEAEKPDFSRRFWNFRQISGPLRSVCRGAACGCLAKAASRINKLYLAGSARNVKAAMDQGGNKLKINKRVSAARGPEAVFRACGRRRAETRRKEKKPEKEEQINGTRLGRP